MRKTILSLVALMVSVSSWAEWVQVYYGFVDGICYEFFTDSHESYAKVISPIRHIQEDDGSDDPEIEWPINWYEGDIVIPPTVTYEGIEYPVTIIDAQAFEPDLWVGGGDMWPSISSVKIPSSVTTIGDNAFASCPYLTSIEIPSSVVEIGIGLFAGCHYLESVTLHENIMHINKNMFWSCHSLKSITIPENVISIDDNAFSYCI